MDGRTHLSSNLLGHRTNDDLKIENIASLFDICIIAYMVHND